MIYNGCMICSTVMGERWYAAEHPDFAIIHVVMLNRNPKENFFHVKSAFIRARDVGLCFIFNALCDESNRDACIGANEIGRVVFSKFAGELSGRLEVTQLLVQCSWNKVVQRIRSH